MAAVDTPQKPTPVCNEMGGFNLGSGTLTRESYWKGRGYRICGECGQPTPTAGTCTNCDAVE